MELIKNLISCHTIALTIGTDNGYLSIDDGEPQWLNMYCVTRKGRFVPCGEGNGRYLWCEPDPYIKMLVRLVGEDGVLEPEVLRQKIRWFVRKSLPLPWQRRRATVLVAVKSDWSQEKQNELKEIVAAAIR